MAVVQPSSQLVRSLPTKRVGSNAGSTTAIIVKSVRVYAVGIYRVTYTLISAGGAGRTHGQLYRNGVAEGNDNSVASGATGQFTEDFSILKANDTIDLYIYDSAANSNAGASSFRIYGSYSGGPAYPLPSVTITDADNAG